MEILLIMSSICFLPTSPTTLLISPLALTHLWSYATTLGIIKAAYTYILLELSFPLSRMQDTCDKIFWQVQIHSRQWRRWQRKSFWYQKPPRTYMMIPGTRPSLS
ncbi:hypothetical protein ASPWEDRAFT_307579 [Aspergillus wentii DTO 134E9]|uniref:Uncharacterized protein n=1 Tax=Aspergillus wentii DTO 134E9 TaxID=1073089 RepID=A0A1L9RSX5_ASPWE|nr:uncharacterized protein ASPWEDRAFT_307579 [Aspergillus wentii DTO 134E9]OJJ38025.1 hypothetical protein ASPWEDRAFT_307579 [Aspergillus wentii DTO 134E9]